MSTPNPVSPTAREWFITNYGPASLQFSSGEIDVDFVVQMLEEYAESAASPVPVESEGQPFALPDSQPPASSIRELADKHGFPPLSREQQDRNAEEAGIEPASPDAGEVLSAEELAEIEKRCEAAYKMIQALCTPRYTEGHREWIMSIPARSDYDPDLVIAAALADIPKLLRACRARKGEKP